jgi:tRNA A37 threonylcarbamoyladenosine dehydratase
MSSSEQPPSSSADEEPAVAEGASVAADKPRRFDIRFDRMVRLVGADPMERIRHAHIGVFGLGGVGSYAAEALARSGVGTLTLVDFDTVCITNFNRQLQAVEGALGQPKAGMLAERLRQINPSADVRGRREFYNRESSDRLLADPPDVLIDCTDNITAKMHLLNECLKRNIAVITVLGAAAKLDPTRVRVVPLTETYADPLARAIRKFTKRRHGVTNDDLERIVAVFSDEPVIMPRTGYRSPVCGQDCVCPGGDNPYHSCARRHVIYGSAVFVTGVFGMVAASVAVRRVAGLPWQTNGDLIPGRHSPTRS